MSAHRAMHLLHLTLSFACSSALSHDISRSLKSFLTVSVQLFLFSFIPQKPNAIQVPAWLALLSLSMRHTCPSHLSLLFLLMLSISSCPILSLILLFVILSCHDT